MTILSDEKIRSIAGLYMKVGIVEKEHRYFDEADAYEAMRRIADRARIEAIEWQPMETAPKDGTSILICDHRRIVGEASFKEDGDGWWWAQTDPTDATDGQCHPTNWMPLPEPPVALLPKENSDG